MCLETKPRNLFNVKTIPIIFVLHLSNLQLLCDESHSSIYGDGQDHDGKTSKDGWPQLDVHEGGTESNLKRG